MEKYLNKVIQGDCLEVMKDIPDGSVDMVLTSPPYDNLRTYNGSLDWGESIWKQVIKELFRIIKDGGVIVWVVGDSIINGSESGTSFKQALFAKECGFNLHDTMIYQKTGGSFPEKTRYTQSFEYMFIFSKGRPKTVNLITDHKNRWSKRWSPKSSIRQKDGTLKDRKNRNTTLNEFGKRFNIWRITNGYGYGSSNEQLVRKHPATFPEKLAEGHILSWSNEGDTILDPFTGSGTTGVVCKNLNRNYILIEKEPQYVDICNARINSIANKLF